MPTLPETQNITMGKAMSVKSATCFKKNGEPYTEYGSEREAAEAAAYVRRGRGAGLSPFECPDCGRWHLSPDERRTPGRICVYCIDSGGRHKMLYESREAALRRAGIIAKERGVALNVYKCPRQHGWHLARGA